MEQQTMIIDTTKFKELDEKIINSEKVVKTSKSKNSYKKHSWYLKEKQESSFMQSLLENKIHFDRLRITIDKVVILISAINSYARDKFRNKNTFFRVPDRLLCSRAECSRETLMYVLNILNELQIIELLAEQDYPRIRLNYSYLENDEYFKIKCSKLIKTDIKKLDKIEHIHNSDFYYDYNYNVYKAKLNEGILGTILVYNDILNDNTMEFHKHRTIKGEQDDQEIVYVEAPIPLLCSMFKLKPQQVMKKLYDLCNHTNYISKHNLVYSDEKLGVNEKVKHKLTNVKHYLNQDYKSFATNKFYKLNDRKGNSYEENHPRVTNFSFIIYLDKLRKHKIGKRISKHYNTYMNTIKTTLILCKDKQLQYKDNIYIDLYNKRFNKEVDNFNNRKHHFVSSEASTSYRQAIGNILFTNGQQNKGIISTYGLISQKHNNGEEYKPRLRFYHNPNSMSIERLLKIQKLFVNTVPKCNTKDLKYYIQKYNEIDEIITNKIYNYYEKHYTNRYSRNY